nr:hypothetical protein Iba_chr15dCG7560 [Ipomoea batatas]
MERSAGRTGSKLAIALLLPLLNMSRRWGGLTLPLESLAGRPPAESIVVAAGYRSSIIFVELFLLVFASTASDAGGNHILPSLSPPDQESETTDEEFPNVNTQTSSKITRDRA